MCLFIEIWKERKWLSSHSKRHHNICLHCNDCTCCDCCLWKATRMCYSSLWWEGGPGRSGHARWVSERRESRTLRKTYNQKLLSVLKTWDSFLSMTWPVNGHKTKQCFMGLSQIPSVLPEIHKHLWNGNQRWHSVPPIVEQSHHGWNEYKPNLRERHSFFFYFSFL